MSEQTYRGSCHCGAVKFEARLDLAKGTGRCNCSFCFKARMWGIQVKPEAFKVLAGEESLSDYVGATNAQGHHLFCKRCGVRPFERGNLEQLGGPYVSVNVACLDDVDHALLAATPINYFDGPGNSWWTRPAVTAHL